MKEMEDPNSVGMRSINLGGALPDGLITEDGGHNARIVRAAQLPGLEVTRFR
jgi:hypothetical protein